MAIPRNHWLIGNPLYPLISQFCPITGHTIPHLFGAATALAAADDADLQVGIEGAIASKPTSG